MKKTILCLLLMATAMTVAAQQYNHNSRAPFFSGKDRYYGLRLGINSASLSSNVATMDYNARAGLNVGAVVGLQLTTSAPIWLETGLFYSQKGGKMTIGGDETTLRMDYLQVPIVVKYSFDVYDDLYIQPFIGGYLALGVGGKVKEYATHQSHSAFDDLNRFDGGLHFGCGVEYMMLYAEVGMEFGLVNINKSDFDTSRNQNIFFTIGVNF